MKDAWSRNPAVRQPIDRGPGRLVALVPAADCPQPVPANDPSELTQGSAIGRHGVIGEVAAHHLPEPRALLVQRRMPMLPESISDLVQLGPHAVASRAPAQQETSGPG